MCNNVPLLFVWIQSPKPNSQRIRIERLRMWRDVNIYRSIFVYESGISDEEKEEIEELKIKVINFNYIDNDFLNSTILNTKLYNNISVRLLYKNFLYKGNFKTPYTYIYHKIHPAVMIDLMKLISLLDLQNKGIKKVIYFDFDIYPDENKDIKCPYPLKEDIMFNIVDFNTKTQAFGFENSIIIISENSTDILINMIEYSIIKIYKSIKEDFDIDSGMIYGIMKDVMLYYYKYKNNDMTIEDFLKNKYMLNIYTLENIDALKKYSINLGVKGTEENSWKKM